MTFREISFKSLFRKEKSLLSSYSRFSTNFYRFAFILFVFCYVSIFISLLQHTVSYVGEEFSLLLFLEFYCIALYFSQRFKPNLIQLLLIYISNCLLYCNIVLTFRYSPVICIFLDSPNAMWAQPLYLLHNPPFGSWRMPVPGPFNLVFTRFTTFLDLRDLLQFLKFWAYYQRLLFSL